MVYGDSAYSAQVVDHYRHPRGSGRLGPPAASGSAGSAAGGCLIGLTLRLRHGRVQEAAFEAFGCPATIACGSWLADWLPGRTLAQAAALTGLDIAAALALDAGKTGVALVAEDALKAALAGAGLGHGALE